MTGQMTSPDGNILQTLQTSCAVKCQQLILQAYGIDIPETQLIEIGIRNKWFYPALGTFMRYNGRLLGCFGIDYHHKQHATLQDAIIELKRRHMVMVNVNKQKLSGGATPYPDACHSILVDEINGKYVYVTDTALGAARMKYTTEEFVDAWEDSLFYMLATRLPAEYRYDPTMRKMHKL